MSNGGVTSVTPLFLFPTVINPRVTLVVLECGVILFVTQGDVDEFRGDHVGGVGLGKLFRREAHIF